MVAMVMFGDRFTVYFNQQAVGQADNGRDAVFDGALMDADLIRTIGFDDANGAVADANVVVGAVARINAEGVGFSFKYIFAMWPPLCWWPTQRAAPPDRAKMARITRAHFLVFLGAMGKDLRRRAVFGGVAVL